MHPKEIIRQQIEKNSGLNLLLRENGLRFSFSDDLKTLLAGINNNEGSAVDLDELTEFTTTAALASFYRVNQYYQFDAAAEEALRQVYRQLIADVRKAGSLDFNRLAEQHFRRLQQWFRTNQPDAELFFPGAPPVIANQVVCAEYSAALQLSTLGINLELAMQPVLDIGCGKEHHLVTFLRQHGLEAFGIDRDTETTAFTNRVSWLEFNYTKNRWGTITSHMAFTNHFRHQHLKQNGRFMDYARRFMEILQALRPGGTFHYAPDLPFIETFLDPQQYRISKQPISNTPFYSVAIQRLH